MEVANRGRGQATRRGLSGRHGRPGAARVSCGVVSVHTELVLCPRTQTRHCVGEGVGMLWGRFSEQHLMEEVVGFFRLRDKTSAVRNSFSNLHFGLTYLHPLNTLFIPVFSPHSF